MSYEVPIKKTVDLTDEEAETLFNALVFARDTNNSEYKGDFDPETLKALINKLASFY